MLFSRVCVPWSGIFSQPTSEFLVLAHLWRSSFTLQDIVMHGHEICNWIIKFKQSDTMTDLIIIVTCWKLLCMCMRSCSRKHPHTIWTKKYIFNGTQNFFLSISFVLSLIHALICAGDKPLPTMEKRPTVTVHQTQVGRRTRSSLGHLCYSVKPTSKSRK